MRHLLRVAAGIDSMVDRRVRDPRPGAAGFPARDRPREWCIASSTTRCARRCESAKRSRTETAIGRNPVSVSSAAVELARQAFANQTLEGKRVLVVGAGKMGRLAMQALHQAGASDVTVVNRGEERAREVEAQFDVKIRPFDELRPAIGEADIVLDLHDRTGVRHRRSPRRASDRRTTERPAVLRRHRRAPRRRSRSCRPSRRRR